MFCPPITAWELHRGLPSSKLYIIPDAGHSAFVSQDSKTSRWKYQLIPHLGTRDSSKVG
jgi:pimeloyl-ACP methyl ester carboxylesterase